MYITMYDDAQEAAIGTVNYLPSAKAGVDSRISSAQQSVIPPVFI